MKGETSIARQAQFIAKSALVLSQHRVGVGHTVVGRPILDAPFISGELCRGRRTTWWEIPVPLGTGRRGVGGPILLLFRSVPRMQSQMCQGTQILSRQ